MPEIVSKDAGASAQAENKVTLKGILKPYRERLGYGFITLAEVQDTPAAEELAKVIRAKNPIGDVLVSSDVMQAVLIRAGLMFLVPGQALEFEAIPSPTKPEKGFVVTDFRISGEVTSPSRPDMPGLAIREPIKIKGPFQIIVKEFSSLRGYGFATLDSAIPGNVIPGYDPAKNKDLMLHVSCLEGTGWQKNDIREGIRLTALEIAESHKGFGISLLAPPSEAARPAPQEGQNPSAVRVAANNQI